MDDWHVPLLISAIVFAAYMGFKMRPAFTAGGRAASSALLDARKKVEDAKDDAARARALADAGDACAQLGRLNGAVGYYRRAQRLAPGDADIIERAGSALARRPAALEKLLWRSLASGGWDGDRRPVVSAALRALEQLYGRRHRDRDRAHAVAHALAALEGEASPKS